MTVNLYSVLFLKLNSEGRMARIFDSISFLPGHLCSLIFVFYLEIILLVFLQCDKAWFSQIHFLPTLTYN